MQAIFQSLHHDESALPPARASFGCAFPGAAIPETFSEEQARLILFLKSLPSEEKAFTQMHHWTPERFSETQRICVLSLLKLKGRDFRETLADGMAPCQLRGQLMRSRDFDYSEVGRLLRQM